MKRRIGLFLAVVMLLSVLAGCGNTPANNNSNSAEPSTRTVTDILGRKVEIPAKVERIIGLSSASRFIVYAGAADKVVGLSELEMKGEPGMPFAYAKHSIFEKCKAVSSGGSGDTFYDEQMVTLEADVIIVLTSEAAKADEIQKQYEKPVIAVYANNFLDKQFQDSLKIIGEVAGTADQAGKVCTAIQGWIDDLNKRTKDIPDDKKPKVYNGGMGFRGPHGFEGTSGNYPPFLAINAKNVADETGQKGAFLVDLEQVTVWDPDIIFLNPSNMYLVNEDYAKNPAFYDNLRAVKEGKLYSQVSFNYFSTNMELAIADAYYAGKIIYPEQFSDVDFNKKAEEIFNTMIGMDYLKVLDDAGIGFGQVKIGE